MTQATVGPVPRVGLDVCLWDEALGFSRLPGGWLLWGACGKVGSQPDSEGMSWSLRSRVGPKTRWFHLEEARLTGRAATLFGVFHFPCSPHLSSPLPP